MKKRFSTFPRLFPFAFVLGSFPVGFPSGVRRSDTASTAIPSWSALEVEAAASCSARPELELDWWWEEGRLIYPNAVGTTERGVSSPANPDRVVWVPMSITIAETSSAFCVIVVVVVVGVVCGVEFVDAVVVVVLCCV